LERATYVRFGFFFDGSDDPRLLIKSEFLSRPLIIWISSNTARRSLDTGHRRAAMIGLIPGVGEVRTDRRLSFVELYPAYEAEILVEGASMSAGCLRARRFIAGRMSQVLMVASVRHWRLCRILTMTDSTNSL